jgi:hypothetical protein
VTSIEQNTLRYVSICSNAVDECLPIVNPGFDKQDTLDVLSFARQGATADGKVS